MTGSELISFVIPVYDEEETLVRLFDKIETVVTEETNYDFEVIFVDDGSTDNSWQTIEVLKEQHPLKVKAAQFRRNAGKAAALQTGFNIARGLIIFSMDADLQDEPTEIPNFLKALDAGYDCVSGWKRSRRDPLSKVLPSRIFNWVTTAASGVKIHDFNCGFKAYRADAIQSIRIYGELHRFIPVLLAAEGYKITEISVEHHERQYGVSKYGWTRLLKGALDLVTVTVITRYLRRPGHFFGGIGAVSGAAGFVILSWLAFQNLVLGNPISHRPLLQFGVLLVIFGVQLVSTGLLGELLISTNSQSQNEPTISKRI